MKVKAEEIAVVISLIYILFNHKTWNTRFSLEQWTGNSFNYSCLVNHKLKRQRTSFFFYIRLSKYDTVTLHFFETSFFRGGKIKRSRICYISDSPISQYCLCGLVFRVPEAWVQSPALSDFLRSSGSGPESTQPQEYNWWATWKKKKQLRSRKSRLRP
jgi:hypothetical protein